LNHQLARIAPQYALKREIARRRLQRLEDFKPRARRSFDAISGDRLRYDFLTTSRSADAAIKNDLGTLRQHVRQLEYNNGFVSGPIARLVKNVVGEGIGFQSQVRADRDNADFPAISIEMADGINRGFEKYVRYWWKISDVRLQHQFNEQQALVCGAIERDNEVLAVLRLSDRPARRRVARVCVELLEIDRLATPLSEIANPAIRSGIEYDDEGVPRYYYVLKTHPGEMIRLAMQRNDYEQVEAFFPNGTRKVLHLFRPVRPEQTRGYTLWASALKDIQDLDRYREAEIMAALEDACMTGIVTTENPVGFQQAFTQDAGGADEERDYDRIHDFAPNQWFYLKPGESAQVHRNMRPNQIFEQFSKDLMRGPANAIDMPPEMFYQDWAGMNYSNARTVLLMFYLSCRIRQKFLIDHFCTPVYETLARELIATGKVLIPGFDRRPEDFLRHGWNPSGWEWVDPIKEAKGKEIDLNNNFETLTSVHAARGRDFEETMETRARELRHIKDLEKTYGIEFPKAKAAAPANANTPAPEAAKTLKIVKS